MTASARQQAWLLAVIGLIGLASAMGIGRFAFTPALPLMQSAGQLSLLQGSWLASINYAGYLLGALLCIWLPPRPARWARIGLFTVAVVTLLMAIGNNVLLWAIWRLLAGVASAFVLVGISAWALNQLAQLNHAGLAGLIYAGVGVGLAVAGLAGRQAGVWGWSPHSFWLLLGALALLVWLAGRWWLSEAPLLKTEQQATNQRFTLDHWRLILCYGIFGLGYILPATFLPAMAREQLGDPAIFGWVWPVFGVAASLSTLLAGRLTGRIAPRRIWAMAVVVLIAGVALPVLSQGLVSLLLSASCVGGTFMVITMTGMQEARARGGARLIAAMTSSFAAGQIIGPLLVNAAQGDMLWPSLLAVLLLGVSFVLLMQRPTD